LQIACITGTCFAPLATTLPEEGAVTTIDTTTADTLLSRIEVATGELMPRDDRNAALIKQIIESVNGLRSLLGVVRTH
jgi:hypothetical protein